MRVRWHGLGQNFITDWQPFMCSLWFYQRGTHSFPLLGSSLGGAWMCTEDTGT